MNELLTIALSVASSLLVGVILAVVPWTSLWDSNYLLQPYPALRLLVLSPLARGTVTGIGLVNILVALHEAYQHLSGRGLRR
jgi:xanthine/uracil permease